MAKVYAAPKSIKVPDFNMVREEYDRDVERYTSEVRAWVKARSKYKDAGMIIRFQVADGYAEYMVLDGASMVHLDILDGYQIPDAHARGIRIPEEVKQQKAWDALFSKEEVK